ncbi:hypothetical protein E2562_036402 [Oryza meyeriana var. granulata]|uniref:Uncharacterized protein n=1 Tax=Oryza meyeriana var. granulata TaxID=110450 RepID=A0A6G1E7F5_9ORYZ|nr:hypothetical protein E2562_036402 [Oryza meyeriana var. granulata]
MSFPWYPIWVAASARHRHGVVPDELPLFLIAVAAGASLVGGRAAVSLVGNYGARRHQVGIATEALVPAGGSAAPAVVDRRTRRRLEEVVGGGGAPAVQLLEVLQAVRGGRDDGVLLRLAPPARRRLAVYGLCTASGDGCWNAMVGQPWWYDA